MFSKMSYSIIHINLRIKEVRCKSMGKITELAASFSCINNNGVGKSRNIKYGKHERRAGVTSNICKISSDMHKRR